MSHPQADLLKQLHDAISDFKANKLTLENAESVFSDFAKKDALRADSLHMLGIVAAEQNKFDESIDLIKQAIGIRSNVSFFHHNLAASYRALGQFDLARQHYEKSIELEPGYAEAYFNLFDSQSFKDGHYLRSRLEEQIRNIDQFSREDQCFLHFAAGKLYDDLGLFDKAFEQFHKGAAARQAKFDIHSYFRHIDELILCHNRDQLANRHAARAKKFPQIAQMKPIFVVSMPRSGSTMVESILAKHPQVNAMGELNDISSIAGTLSSHPKISGRYPANLLKVSDEVLNSFASQYLKRVSNQSRSRSVDKMPINHRHVGLISLLFPGAKILHCKRDPRDVCLSCFTKRFRRPHEYSYNLNHLAAFYAGYHRLMNHWHSNCPIPIQDIRYEELVENQEEMTRKILAYCELTWDESCLEFNTSKRSIRTASSWQTRQGIYRSSLARWKNYAKHLRPLAKTLAKFGVQVGSKNQSQGNRDDQINELNRLGTVAQSKRKFKQAIEYFDQAIQFAPEIAVSYYNRGNAQLASGAANDAAESYRQAIRLKPDYVRALNNLAATELITRNYQSAIGASGTAIELAPKFTAAHANMARALAAIDKYSEATKFYERAIELDPKNVGYRLDLIAALGETGQFERLKAECKAVIEINRNAAKAYSWLCRLAPESISAAQKNDLQNIAANKKLPVSDQRIANFALARLEDFEQNFDAAFRHYSGGNRLTRSVHRPQRNENMCSNIIDFFSEDFFAENRIKGAQTEQPVFIIGMPRSGTSLTAAILDAHPAVTNIGESSGIKVVANKNFRNGVRPLYSRPTPKLITNEKVDTAANQYLDIIQSLAKTDAERIVDKWPSNFFHLGLVALMFPNAKIIHCFRDAMDTCLSCYFQNFSGVAYANNLQHIGLFYNQYRRLMRHWQQHLGPRIYDFSYEQLVQQPVPQITGLIEFCGLPQSNDCLEFWKRDQVVKTASATQVREPIAAKAVGRWKHYRKHLVALAEIIGYDMDSDS